MNSDDVISLQQSYKDGRLIPFIGSGFSKPLGLPDWHTLVGKVASKLEFDESLFFIHGSYPQLLEFVKKFHVSEWRTFLHNIRVEFDSQEVNERREQSKPHSTLASLQKIKTIYTTNYDLQIEKALESFGRKPIILSSLPDFMDKHIDSDCEVIKFHGTLEQEDTIILTESEYFRRMNLEEPVDQRLRSDLLSNNFLFIGYSFNDTNIRYIWYKINELKERLKIKQEFDLRPSYYVTFSDEPIQYKLLESWGIKTINLDPVDKETSLADFLQCLSNE